MNRAERIAALSDVLRKAAREYLELTDGDYWPSGVADAQARAVIAAQEGERGGTEVAAAVEALLADFDTWQGHDTRDIGHAYHGETVRDMVVEVRAALADPAGALAKHDAEVLRAAADEEDWRGVMFNRDGLNLTPENRVRHRLRERADRIEGAE